MGLRHKVASKSMTSPSPDPKPSRTSLSRDEQLIRRALDAPDPERERFLEELSRAVRSGEYNPSSEAIAEALMMERILERATCREYGK